MLNPAIDIDKSCAKNAAMIFNGLYLVSLSWWDKTRTLSVLTAWSMEQETYFIQTLAVSTLLQDRVVIWKSHHSFYDHIKRKGRYQMENCSSADCHKM